MNIKAGDRVRQTQNCSGTIAGKIYTVKHGDIVGDHKELLWIWDESTPIEGGCSCVDQWEPVINRSSIGKKAYKTFLKNGGTRNARGQFSKKQVIDWKKIAEDLYKAYISTPYVLSDYSIENTKEFAKVFKKHGLIREGVNI